MRHPFFTADTGAASTAGASTAHAGSDVAETPPPEEKKFSQAELDKIVEDRLARQRRATEAQQREKEQAIETQRLEDQKEFEKLAKQRADEINALKPRAGLADSYEKSGRELIEVYTETFARDIPSSTLMILEKLSLPDQLAWIVASIKQMAAPARTPASADTNAWSRGGSGPQALTDEEYRKRKREESIYR
jgi:hypothetical protein